jgi:hypothetical protein
MLTMASGESIPIPTPTPINRERRTILLCQNLLNPPLFTEAHEEKGMRHLPHPFEQLFSVPLDYFFSPHFAKE